MESRGAPVAGTHPAHCPTNPGQWAVLYSADAVPGTPPPINLPTAMWQFLDYIILGVVAAAAIVWAYTRMPESGDS